MTSIIYDVFRLFTSSGVQTPRGIDRTDLAYARYLFRHWDGPCFGVMPTPWGVRLYERQRVLAGLDHLESLWREYTPACEDKRLGDVAAFLAGTSATSTGSAGSPAASRMPPWLRRLIGPGRLLASIGFTPGRSAVRNGPHGSMYLNVGQFGWAAAAMTSWLRHRPDIKPVFMLHDVIPLDRPELMSRGGRWSHEQMLKAVARHAVGLITTTEAATCEVLPTLARYGHTPRFIQTLPLPVSRVFIDAVAHRPARPDARPYFVVCGAIELRKNHDVLLKAWEKLVQSRGDAAPLLVVVGSPTTSGGPVLRRMRAASHLHRHLIVVSGLATQGLCQLIAEATAVLMPSLAEGFGLPIVESLTLGTPVIASDLPAHREAAGAFAIYLDTTDVQAWADAVAHLADGGPDVAARRGALAAYRPMTEHSYFASLAEFLGHVGTV